jgi:ankyrin repeat protein
VSRATRAAAVAAAVIVGLLLLVGPAGLRLRRQQVLVHAAAKGQMPIIRAGVALGADPSSNLTGGYPLYAAAWNGHADAVELLLGYGAGVDATEASGATALMAAAGRGDDAVVRRLLAHGASLTAAMDCGNALDIAVANRHDTTAAILAAAGATPSRRQ